MNGKYLWSDYFLKLKRLVWVYSERQKGIELDHVQYAGMGAMDYGILSIQGITVPIYQTVPAEDLAHTLNNCEAKILIVETPLFLKFQTSSKF